MLKMAAMMLKPQIFFFFNACTENIFHDLRYSDVIVLLSSFHTTEYSTIFIIVLKIPLPNIKIQRANANKTEFVFIIV